MFSYFLASISDEKKRRDNFVKIKSISKKVFLVMDKNSMTPIGIFDNLDDAKKDGERATYYNCIIIPFNVNEQCKYLIDSIYESK